MCGWLGIGPVTQTQQHASSSGRGHRQAACCHILRVYGTALAGMQDALHQQMRLELYHAAMQYAQLCQVDVAVFISAQPGSRQQVHRFCSSSSSTAPQELASARAVEAVSTADVSALPIMVVHCAGRGHGRMVDPCSPPRTRPPQLIRSLEQEQLQQKQLGQGGMKRHLVRF